MLTDIWRCTNCILNIGTCEASRFEFESEVPIRFDSTVMGRFENFRIGRVCPLLVVVRRLKPLTALSGTVYRLASFMSDHTPVLFNMFEPLRIGMRICSSVLITCVIITIQNVRLVLVGLTHEMSYTADSNSNRYSRFVFDSNANCRFAGPYLNIIALP